MAIRIGMAELIHLHSNITKALKGGNLTSAIRRDFHEVLIIKERYSKGYTQRCQFLQK